MKVLDLRNAGSSKPEQFSGHSGRILSLVFSPDSRFLIAGGTDPRVPVWDPEEPRQAPVTLRVHEGPVWRVGFRQPFIGHRSADETVILWHVGLSHFVAVACRTAGRQLSDEEVSDIVGDCKQTGRAWTNHSDRQRAG